MKKEEFVALVGEEVKARSLKFAGSFEFELGPNVVVEEPSFKYEVFEDYVTVDLKIRKNSDFAEVLSSLFDNPKKLGVVSSWLLWKGSKLLDYPVLESASSDKDYLNLRFRGKRGGSSISEKAYQDYINSGSRSFLDRLEEENEDRIRAGFERR